eukprot:10552776-Alexandrium_andersonii.AAC.1
MVGQSGARILRASGRSWARAGFPTNKLALTSAPYVLGPPALPGERLDPPGRAHRTPEDLRRHFGRDLPPPGAR